MKIIHNKNTKITDNINKITYEHERTTLEKYVEITAELSSIENKKELFISWLIVSAAILGVMIFFSVFLALIENSESIVLDRGILFYGCLCILAYTSKDFLYLSLVLNITKSKLTMRDKLNRIENHHLIYGRYLTFTKCIIFVLGTLFLLSFFNYFTVYFDHPLLISLFIYLSLISVINVIKKNVSFIIHIAFLILMFLLYVYNLILVVDLRHEAEYEDAYAQSDVNNGDDDDGESIQEIVDNGMYEIMKEREQINELVYKPDPVETKLHPSN